MSKIHRIFFIFLCMISFLNAQNSKLDSLLSELKKEKKDTSIVKLYNAASGSASKITPDSGIYYSNKALALAQKLVFKRGVASSYYNLALYNQYKGNYKANNEFGEKALLIYEELHNEKRIYDCYNIIGNGYGGLSDFNKSLEFHLKALKGREKIKDSSTIAMSLMNVGRVFRVQGDFQKAITYYRQALELSLKKNLNPTISNCLNNIGNVYFNQKLYDSSLVYQYRSLSVNKRLNNMEGMLTNFTNIAGNYYYQKKFDSALKYYNSALPIALTKDDKVVVSSCYEGFAAIYGERKQYAKSIEYFNKTLALAQEMGNVERTSGVYKDLSEIYALSNNYKDAYEAFKNHKLLYDSVFNQNNTKKLTETTLKYEFEKQQELEKEEALRKELIQNEKSKNQQQLIYIFLIGFVIVLILLFFSVRNYRLKQKANTELESKNLVIEEKNRDITDSIKYAKRLQDAILPPTHFITNCFREAFVLFKPKDIVSGDFYWMEKIGDDIFFAVVDCTGHGVPGAFMSIMAHNLIQQAIHEKNLKNPAEILNYINISLNEKLNTQDVTKVNDGMDLALCVYNSKSNEIKYAGANNPLWIVNTEGELIEIAPDKSSIGFQNTVSFNQKVKKLQKGSMLYLFSDGYADQFGGESGKKLMKKTLKNILSSIFKMEIPEQQKILNAKLEEWKGNLQQVDDICVLGIRI